MGTSTFWLVSVVIEQADGDIEGESKKGYLPKSSILSAWLLSSVLLRNFYNSSMYSFLAKTFGPEDIPLTIRQLFYSHKMPILAEHDLANILSYQLTVFQRFHKLAGESQAARWKRVIAKTSNVVSMRETDQFVTNVREGNQLPCMPFEENKKGIFRHKFETRGRFAFLYSLNGWVNEHSPRFILPMLTVLGKRSVIENLQEPTFLVEPILWFSARQTFLTKSFEWVIGSLTNSGLFMKMKLAYETKLQAEVIEDVDRNGELGNKWNLITYATQVCEKRHKSMNGIATQDDHVVKMHEFIIILIIYITLLMIALISFSGEHLYLWKM